MSTLQNLLPTHFARPVARWAFMLQEILFRCILIYILTIYCIGRAPISYSVSVNYHMSKNYHLIYFSCVSSLHFINVHVIHHLLASWPINLPLADLVRTHILIEFQRYWRWWKILEHLHIFIFCYLFIYFIYIYCIYFNYIYFRWSYFCCASF